MQLGRVLVMTTISAVAGLLPAAAQVRCPTRECDPSLLTRRVLHAGRIDGHRPIIDGRIDEPVWREAEPATDFVEGSPRPAVPAGLHSEARVLVDEDAIYIALTYDDPSPGGIRSPLARRDDEATSDWAFVEIDSRHDRRSGFSFGVNPRGVQVDGLWVGDTGYDTSWNGVWQAAALVDETGWHAEFRIPFSQLAFTVPPDAAEMVWGINFYRYSPAHGESSNWSPRFRGLGGVVSNFNDLRLPAPARVNRFEVTPYVAPRTDSAAPPGRRRVVSAGADARMGIGANATVTATVLPDFGQVEADPAQVNLTAFELFQPERRPFFLEGLEVFQMDTSLAFSSRDVSFANESPFYSRRIGRASRSSLRPGDTIEWRQQATAVLGAAKVIAQRPGGWTTGLFTALTDREDAYVGHGDGSASFEGLGSGEAFTVGRATRALRGGEGSLGLFAANAHAFEPAADTVSGAVGDQTVAGFDVQERFAHRNYEVRAWTLVSRTAVPATADPTPAGSGDGDSLGLSASARLSRVNGAFRWDLTERAVSPRFDMNEIGFQQNADWLLSAGSWRYERFPATGHLRAWTVGSNSPGLGWNSTHQRLAAVADSYLSLDTRNYWNVRLSAAHEWSAFSTDRLRGGPALLLPPRDTIAMAVATDQRKATFASVDAGAMTEPASGSRSRSLDALVNVRTSDHLQWSLGPGYQSAVVGWQYIGGLGVNHSDFIVSRVQQRTLAFTLRADLIASPHLSLQVYARPFATAGSYDRYQQLIAPADPDPNARFRPAQADTPTGTIGIPLDLDADGIADTVLAPPDGTRRQLDANVVARWEYRPGSFITAVWTQRREGSNSDGLASSSRGLGELLSDHAADVVIVKMSLRIGK